MDLMMRHLVDVCDMRTQDGVHIRLDKDTLRGHTLVCVSYTAAGRHWYLRQAYGEGISLQRDDAAQIWPKNAAIFYGGGEAILAALDMYPQVLAELETE